MDEQWKVRYDAIQARVQAAIPKPCHVIFSAYKETPEGWPLDNLDEVAVEGKACFIDDISDVPYRSAVVDNPTWLTVAKLANEMILATEDLHHIFLEAVSEEEVVDGVKIVEFVMGS